MTFTDDDLKQLKELCDSMDGKFESWSFVEKDGATIKALLARLEAAEAYVKFDHRNWVEGGPKQQGLYIAWRKSKGEGK